MNSPVNGLNDPWFVKGPTAIIVLQDGTVIKGTGLGSVGIAVGEICFNTAITGYQEILTDPSYAGQIITFTFPHIGNVGANVEDIETGNLAAASGVRGCILRTTVTEPSNYRSTQHFDEWLRSRGIIGMANVDTRALTSLIRERGMLNAAIAYEPSGQFNLDELQRQVSAWPGLEGMDLAKEVTCTQTYDWTEKLWSREAGFEEQTQPEFHVVAIDYGLKRNILRCLANVGCHVTVVPATSTSQDILRHKPDGIFLSNGPGDPAATGLYAVPVIKELIEADLPIFGICLGHQLLALALGATTKKMHQGHHGANHPVKDFTTNKVEITSMNHGFTVDRDTLPDHIEETHISLFDGSNCGIRVKNSLIFSVQYHPEASPGPQDSHYLFTRFADLIREADCKIR